MPKVEPLGTLSATSKLFKPPRQNPEPPPVTDAEKAENDALLKEAVDKGTSKSDGGRRRRGRKPRRSTLKSRRGRRSTRKH